MYDQMGNQMGPQGGCGGGMCDQGPRQGKPGDWPCPNCGFHNFAKNETCKRCETVRPEGFGPGMGMQDMMGQPGGCGGCGGGMYGQGQPQGQQQHQLHPKPGDWPCPSCGFHNFAKNETCRRCGTNRPEGVLVVANPGGGMQEMMGHPGGCAGGCGGPGGGMQQQGGKGDMRPGDWACPSCGFHNFSKNEACRRCGTSRPEGAGMAMQGGGQMMGCGGGCGGGGCGGPNIRPGDWFCQACGNHNFARNVACKRCGAPKPDGAPDGGRPRSRSPLR